MIRTRERASLEWKTRPDLCNSDHYPIFIISVTRISDKRANLQSSNRWLCDKVDQLRFKRATLNLNSNIDKLVSDFNNVLITATLQTVLSTKEIINKRAVPWWFP